MSQLLDNIWHVILLVLHRHYPPRVFVFYPLYRVLRRRLGIPMAASVLLVWTVSAVLHGGILLCTGAGAAAVVFGAIFVILGVASSIVALNTKRTCRSVLQAAGTRSAQG